MPDNTHTDSHLIILSGQAFRSEVVNCPDCDWRGLAGHLKVPSLDTLGAGLLYACPSCQTVIACHKGLSTGEVVAELRQIRRMLDHELLEQRTLPHGAEQRITQNAQFARLRAQLNYSLDNNEIELDPADRENTLKYKSARKQSRVKVDFGK